MINFEFDGSIWGIVIDFPSDLWEVRAVVSEVKQNVCVWVVLDEKAGHRSQTMGLLECLKQDFAVETVEMSYRSWTRPLGRLLQKCWPWGTAFAECGSVGKDKNSLRKPDLVIGSGGGVQWAVVALARKHGAFSIYLGSPRAIPVRDYGMVLHYVQELEQRGVCMLPMMPGPITAARTILAAKNFTDVQTDLSGKMACCLVGGHGSGYKWAESDGKLLAERLNRWAEEGDLRWLITTSRRTPLAMEQALRAHLSPHNIADACWAGAGDERRVVAAYLGLAERVLVSEDSMSMMHEALASEKPVAVFSSLHHQANQRHENFLLGAERHGWLLRISIAESDKNASFLDHACRFDADLQKIVRWAVSSQVKSFLRSKA